MEPKLEPSSELFRFVYPIPGTDGEEIHIAASGWVDSLKLLENYIKANRDVYPEWKSWCIPPDKFPINITTHRIYSVRRPGFMYRHRPESFYLAGNPAA